MSKKVLYLGLSGSGKSSSFCKIEDLGIKGLDPKTTGLINVIGKDLDMRRWEEIYNLKNKNYLETRDTDQILQYMEAYSKMPNIKSIVIDDFQYILSLKFIDDLSRKSGGDAFAKYNEVLVSVKRLFEKASSLRKDIIVYILSHVEEYNDETGILKSRFKAVGKATHKYLTPEGFFNIVLYGESKTEGDKVIKHIRTQGGENDSCKTPSTMFKNSTILNDLSIVEKNIRDYYGI